MNGATRRIFRPYVAMFHVAYDVSKHESIFQCRPPQASQPFQVNSSFPKLGLTNHRSILQSGHSDSDCCSITDRECLVDQLATDNVGEQILSFDGTAILTKKQEPFIAVRLILKFCTESSRTLKSKVLSFLHSSTLSLKENASNAQSYISFARLVSKVVMKNRAILQMIPKTVSFFYRCDCFEHHRF